MHKKSSKYVNISRQISLFFSYYHILYFAISNANFHTKIQVLYIVHILSVLVYYFVPKAFVGDINFFLLFLPVKICKT